MLKSIFVIAGCLLAVSSCKTESSGEEALIPKPVKWEKYGKKYNIKGKSIRIEPAGDNDILKQAEILVGDMKKEKGLSLSSDKNGEIVLHMDNNPGIPKEGYILTVNEDGICIKASDKDGIFYGIQTLVRLTSKKGEIGYCKIEDHPAFGYRGLHLDVSRHFMSVEYIKKQLYLMSQYKFNKFHWHIVDGGGWRFESKKYPELTQKGSSRTRSDWDEWWGGNDRTFVDAGTEGSYGGFYTVEQMKEIVKYAEERHITIIPEIEMPGHSNEVLYVFPELSCFGKESNSSEFCIGNPKTFDFLKDILDEVIEIFPGKYIHIGGDEANKEFWKKCPKCIALMKKEGLKNENELQSYCIRTIEEYLNSKGKEIIGWDEILEGGLAKNAVVMSWRGEEGGKTAAKMKHGVIMTPGKPLYFDFYQAPPMNEPKAIGGYNTLKMVYEYHPIPEDLPEESRKYIMGAQANLWTEYIGDEKQAEYMTWPRAAALSEVLWTPEENKDYEDFLKRVNICTKELIKSGVNAFPLKNMNIDLQADSAGKSFKVHVTKENLNADIRYTLDGSIPTHKSALYKGKIDTKDASVLTLQLFDGKKPLFNPVQYSVDYHKAIGKKVIYNNPYDRNGYPAGGDNALTDGKYGTWTYLDNLWQGFTNPMDITIDMGKEETINSVKMKFMQVKGAWVYTPDNVELLLGNDGINFESAGIIPTKISTEDYETRFENFEFTPKKKARFLRVKAALTKAQKNSFIFTDEIIVH